MSSLIHLPDHIETTISGLSAGELAKLAGVTFRTGDREACAICLAALRRIEAAPLSPDPAQLTLFASGGHHV